MAENKINQNELNDDSLEQATGGYGYRQAGEGGAIKQKLPL